MEQSRPLPIPVPVIVLREQQGEGRRFAGVSCASPEEGILYDDGTIDPSASRKDPGRSWGRVGLSPARQSESSSELPPEVLSERHEGSLKLSRKMSFCEAGFGKGLRYTVISIYLVPFGKG